jgi:hypothetical protein
LGAHLFHQLAHGRNVPGRAAFDPLLITLRSLFQVRAERFGYETLSECGHNRLDHFPTTEKLTASFEKQIFM